MGTGRARYGQIIDRGRLHSGVRCARQALRLHHAKEPSVASEKDTHPGVEDHGVMERRLIGWMDKHLHVRPNLAVLGETQPVKRFEDILMRLAEIGGA